MDTSEPLFGQGVWKEKAERKLAWARMPESWQWLGTRLPSKEGGRF
jgi:hypothetical protein